MRKRTIENMTVRGRRVLVRVDFNVPIADGAIGDDTRIRAALPTIRTILANGGKAILMSHLGRPKGKPDPAFTLRPVADRLKELLGAPVHFADHATGPTDPASRQAINVLNEGEVLVLENTRFHPGETKNDPDLAGELAAFAELYVNDAFGTCHRAHASTEGVAHRVKEAGMGLLLDKEIEYLSKLLDSPEPPYVAVLGGAKVSDKIGVIQNLLDRVDALLIGGAMSYTFLKALGHETGVSRVETDRLDDAKALYEQAGGKIRLPVDHVTAGAFDNEAPRHIVSGAIPEGQMGLDIGPETIREYGRAIGEARTIVWNGPMGVFEMSNFAAGTFAVAKALAGATAHGALTVVGGGDSVAAVSQAGYEKLVSHVSTGGGAMLEFLEGKILPGIAALSDR
ncbi:MAG: phosphoglycerate kinase [Bacteroidetes bacterium SB0662_bin_6]|nr:phosphoglycerate kinase [Bacteroidetes bacterium SB0668_bin_1]MYE03529.1 phosphoglycerate kinase [Bacteroidetes bacterium SB0662_bin_6]